MEKFECDDKYEAEKLTGFLAIQEDNNILLDGLANIVQNEVVIVLKDRSSHSIMMKDRATAFRLKSLIEEVLLQKKRILGSNFKDYVAEIIIS
ncbi:MAG TPA: hypothetical protein VEH06_06100 [Candidatus Bathyarchaeia archaeon]|nr:hypothetical protein [Candidatus Bathyarchaeia archaeon]